MQKHVSPLRYPGGKFSLVPFLARTIQINGLEGGHYAEPFAGGAGAALALLYNELISDAHLNDRDPAIASMWTAILENTNEFISLIRKASLTVNYFRRQQQIVERNAVRRMDSVLHLGFAAFYINRCSRSGVYDSGPIGGYDQTGKWKIDARFNRDYLVDQISRVSLYKTRIHVSNQTASSFLRRWSKSSKTDLKRSIVYHDPPYFRMGHELYRHYFSPSDHAKYADFVNAEIDYKWLISYDDCPEIHDLYSHRDKNVLRMNYFVHRARIGRELIIGSPDCLLATELLGTDSEENEVPNSKVAASRIA